MIKHFNKKKGYCQKSKSTSSRLNNKYYTYEIDNKGNFNYKKTFYRNDNTVIETITNKIL
jgi:hypothetical protein